MVDFVKKFLDRTRKAWDLPRPITVSDWADRSRVLPLESAEPGQWRTERTPYLQGPMDAFCDPDIETITLMMPTQVGKTESMLNMLGYAADEDPGPALWVHSAEELAKELCRDRIIPMFQLSESLAGRLLIDTERLSKKGIKLDRMRLYLAWAQSAKSLASRPIRYVFLDETDKYPAYSGKEADPTKLATERTKTFWNRKIVKCSTPTTEDGYIWREYLKTDMCRFFMPCPHCGKYQVLDFQQLKWPKDERDTEKIIRDQLVCYECEHCKNKITNVMKYRMLTRGVWAPTGCGVAPNGRIVGKQPRTRHKGFWMNALYAPWANVTWSHVAAEFLASKEDPALLMNFVNSWLAQIWQEKTRKSSNDFIRKRSIDYPAGTVPDEALLLTAACDVQEHCFYLAIRGWGYGQESWLCRACRVESWTDVINILFKTVYHRRHKEPLPVRLACFDTGYKTDEVYAICREYFNIARAIKGNARLNGIPFKASKIDRYPGTGALIPGGLVLWHIAPDYFKDKVYRLAYSNPEDPSQWHLHKNPSEDYIKQFCSEDKVLIRDKKSRFAKAHHIWKKKTYGAANHYWDCEVYNAAAAEMLGVPGWRETANAVVHQPDKDDDRGDWIKQNTQNWLK